MPPQRPDDAVQVEHAEVDGAQLQRQGEQCPHLGLLGDRSGEHAATGRSGVVVEIGDQHRTPGLGGLDAGALAQGELQVFQRRGRRIGGRERLPVDAGGHSDTAAPSTSRPVTHALQIRPANSRSLRTSPRRRAGRSTGPASSTVTAPASGRRGRDGDRRRVRRADQDVHQVVHDPIRSRNTPPGRRRNSPPVLAGSDDLTPQLFSALPPTAAGAGPGRGVRWRRSTPASSYSSLRRHGAPPTLTSPSGHTTTAGGWMNVDIDQAVTSLAPPGDRTGRPGPSGSTTSRHIGLERRRRRPPTVRLVPACSTSQPGRSRQERIRASGGPHTPTIPVPRPRRRRHRTSRRRPMR